MNRSVWVRPYQADDVLRMDVTSSRVDKSLLNSVVNSFASHSSNMLHVFESAEGICAVFGYGAGADDKKCHIWGVVGAPAKKHPFGFFRIAKKMLEYMSSFRRISVDAEVGYTEACKFIEKLGFVKEGIMKYHGMSGEHHALYARYKNG